MRIPLRGARLPIASAIRIYRVDDSDVPRTAAETCGSLKIRGALSRDAGNQSFQNPNSSSHVLVSLVAHEHAKN